jgi:bile acid-coenzyme A ligase
MSATPLGVAIDRLAEADPDEPALICGDAMLTRAALALRTNRLARVLAERGVTQGSMVTIGLKNGFGFYETVVAAWKLGAVPQPVSYRLPPAELRSIIELADPSMVVGLEPEPGRPWLPAGYEPPATVSDAPLPPIVSPAWKAPTSGGSTGRPKLIVSGYPGVVASLEGYSPLLSMVPGERFLCTGPLYHNGPLLFSLVALVMGGRVIIMEHFDAASTLELAELHRITYLYLVPTMMSRILRLPDRERLGRDLSSVRVAYHLAAPCPPHVKRAWIDWLGPERILELYAGTEAQAVTRITGTEWLAHPGSVGRVFRGHMRIWDAAGEDVPPGVVGEVWMRPPDGWVTYRYIGATATTRDGWETLGDLGHLDEDGYLYLDDRSDDMILVGGSNVYPAEIEAALEEHPDVVSCCVIGLPDEDYGSVVHAIVETTGPIDEDGLRRHLAARLTPYKLPRSFERSSEPLRDEAGKVRRRALREQRVQALQP